MDEGEIRGLIASLQRYKTDYLQVEAKASRHECPKKLWESMSAFATTPDLGGGVILLGVDERQGFAVTGVEDVRRVQSAVQAMASNMSPRMHPPIEIHDIDGKQVISVEIDELPPDQKPCGYEPGGRFRGAYRRTGDGDVSLTNTEIQAFLRERGLTRDDAEPVPGTSITDLDQDLVRRFLDHVRHRKPELYRGLSDEEALQQLSVTDPKTSHLTIAGLVALGRSPASHVPKLRVEFLYFPNRKEGVPNSEGARFLDNKVFDGPLAEIYPLIVARLLEHLGEASRIIKDRVNEPELPEIALREAIVNALVHRDLSESSLSRPVQVKLFPDRVEINNPGGLYQLSVDRLGERGQRVARGQNASAALPQRDHGVRSDLPARLAARRSDTGLARRPGWQPERVAAHRPGPGPS